MEKPSQNPKIKKLIQSNPQEIGTGKRMGMKKEQYFWRDPSFFKAAKILRV